ncbi:MAG: CBS domain-containing protein, partial [Firmicutes bacterium]|nr:CBS domain-containing protein [Bacillota bacterium]
MGTLITTHAHVDFDALASVVAALKIYPRAVILLPGQINNNVRSFLNLYRDYLPLIETDLLSEHYRLVVLVDTRRPSRLHRKIEGFLERGADLHIYDHHPDREKDLVGSKMVVETVGATVTLLLEEIRNRELPITELEATIMAMGIYEDTGYLTFSSTTSRDVEALAFLWKKKINLDVIQGFLQRPLTAGQKTLLEKLIMQTEFMNINQRKILLSWASAESYILGIADLIHRLSSLEEVEAAFCLVKMEGKIHVVARSFNEDINLLNILSFWKAEGHSSATSLVLKYDSIFRARRELTELLRLGVPLPLTARNIASAPVKTVDANTSVAEVMQLLEKYGHSGFPVMDDDRRLAGVISRKDLQKAVRHKLGHAPVKAFMSKKVITAAQDQSIKSLRRLMIDYNIGRIPILDEKGGLYGMVTRTDIPRSLYRMDAERVDLHKRLVYVARYPEIAAVDDDIKGLDDLTSHINSKLSPGIQRLLLLISRNAEKEGGSVYLVGGSIRDILLDSFNSGDLDIVVIPEAIPFARKINDILKGRLQTYEPFGTASITMEDGTRIDLVTARKEFYPTPAALPEVEASGLKNDLFRRDFSINTLACSLNGNSFGKLYDFFGGLQDLQDGIIR